MEPLNGAVNESHLRPFAMRSADSRGRVHAEPGHPFRAAFQRDRDRIVHSAAFRRLAYKTQVFVNHEGDYYRTRLTHTLEVAQVGRSIARAIGVNEDLTEAVVLAHDLGHAPFGHAGQDVLDELMAEHGGFEHNRQSLRIIDLLERRHPEFRGINLSYEVRDSILKHSKPEIRRELGLDIGRKPLLEGQIADLADSIAYGVHDVDDALKARILRWEELADLSLWRRALERWEQALERAGPDADCDPRVRRREVTRGLLSLQVESVITHTLARIAEAGVDTPDAVRDHGAMLVGLGPELGREKAEFQSFLFERVYRHYRMNRMARKARRFLTLLFETYVTDPSQMPPEYQEWKDQVGLHRGVCDYIAGMTDRFVQREVQTLTEPFERT